MAQWINSETQRTETLIAMIKVKYDRFWVVSNLAPGGRYGGCWPDPEVGSHNLLSSMATIADRWLVEL